MIYTLAMIVLIEFVIIMQIYTKLRLAQETERSYALSVTEVYEHSKEYLKNYNQAILDDVVNEYEDSLKDMFKKNNNKGETK